MARKRSRTQQTSKLSQKDKLEQEFRTYWRILGDGSTWTEQHRGIESHLNKKGKLIYTRHSFDFAMPDLKIAIEIQGGIFGRGRHVRPRGYHKDRKKIRMAMLQGWIVLEYTTIDLKPKHYPAMIEEICTFLKMRRAEIYAYGTKQDFSAKVIPAVYQPILVKKEQAAS